MNRVFRRVGIGFLLFLLLLGIGRLVQKSVDSWWYNADFGPYIQVTGPRETVIHWETAEPEAGVLRYGRSPDTLDRTARESDELQHHRIVLRDLKPDTEYWYSVGGETFSLRTAPLPGQDRPVRLWVLGDPGYTGPRVEAVRSAAREWMKAHPRPELPELDLILTTGDNAYRSGRKKEFHRSVFETFGTEVATHAYWPAFGNHDSRRWAFYDLFEFPEHGQLGGIPSDTERYFSFDYGPVHVVFLDTQGSNLDADGAMVRWLEKDLSATEQPWRIVVFHHPPYTRGSHDSDDPFDSGGRMIETRTNILPVLERHGTDLVLTGHSHVYERSHLIGCHYGPADTARPSMVLDDGTDGAYNKPAGPLAHQGTVYAVVGASSEVNTGSASKGHPALPVRRAELGSLIIDVDGPRLEARYLSDAGEETDRFVLMKDLAAPRPGNCQP